MSSMSSFSSFKELILSFGPAFVRNTNRRLLPTVVNPEVKAELRVVDRAITAMTENLMLTLCSMRCLIGALALFANFGDKYGDDLSEGCLPSR